MIKISNWHLIFLIMSGLLPYPQPFQSNLKENARKLQISENSMRSTLILITVSQLWYKFSNIHQIILIMSGLLPHPLLFQLRFQNNATKLLFLIFSEISNFLALFWKHNWKHKGCGYRPDIIRIIWCSLNLRFFTTIV